MYKKRPSTDRIFVHCAATPPTMDIGAHKIRQWHKAKGWLDIGYHYVITRGGTVETGRPHDVMGAGVPRWRDEDGNIIIDFNATSLHICMVGGVDEDGNAEDNFTQQQFMSLKWLLHVLRHVHPQAEILGHRDAPSKPAKACPSFEVEDRLKEWGLPRIPKPERPIIK